MLIPQDAQYEKSPRRHGRRTVKLAELRSCLAEPSRLTNQHRQRLLELIHRLDRVRALGDEYAGVQLSESAAAALSAAAARNAS